VCRSGAFRSAKTNHCASVEAALVKTASLRSGQAHVEFPSAASDRQLHVGLFARLGERFAGGYKITFGDLKKSVLERSAVGSFEKGRNTAILFNREIHTILLGRFGIRWQLMGRVESTQTDAFGLAVSCVSIGSTTYQEFRGIFEKDAASGFAGFPEIILMSTNPVSEGHVS